MTSAALGSTSQISLSTWVKFTSVYASEEMSYTTTVKECVVTVKVFEESEKCVYAGDEGKENVAEEIPEDYKQDFPACVLCRIPTLAPKLGMC